ncbi:hypothetical protein SRHO_G00236550 [Serrasalmus rhombeus]
MELVLRGLQWDRLLIYLDDVIILGEGVEQSIQRLSEVFSRLQNFGLKLKPTKCQLLKDEGLFLGHVVSGEGIRTNPALVRDVQNWRPPTNLRELQAFLRLCNYYRRFVAKFSDIASPLTLLLKKGAVFTWGKEQQGAFECLKESLVRAPILAFPTSEEILCNTIKFTRQFRHYLLGRPFLLRTDHSSLAWLFRFKQPEGQLAWWLEELSQYNFVIQHRAGTSHSNADALSRKGKDQGFCDCYQAGKELDSLPCRGCSFCQKLEHQWARFEEDVDDVVPLAVRRTSLQEEKSEDAQDAEQLSMTVDTRVSGEVTLGSSSNWLQPMDRDSLRREQLVDPNLSVLHRWMTEG